MARQHATKKTPAQLQHEIDQALAQPRLGPTRRLSPDPEKAMSAIERRHHGKPFRAWPHPAQLRYRELKDQWEAHNRAMTTMWDAGD